MANKNKFLSLFSDAGQEAFDGIPDLDNTQRLEFLALDESELALVNSCKGFMLNTVTFYERLFSQTSSGRMMFRTISRYPWSAQSLLALFPLPLPGPAVKSPSSPDAEIYGFKG